jgi:hypothetical protein
MLDKIFRVCGALFVSVALGGNAARCNTITAGLFPPFSPSGSSSTVVALTGISSPSQATIITPAYTVAFAGTGPGQGVVSGTIANGHVAPVAAVSGGTREYLTDDFSSTMTTNIAASANYFSTGLGTITITFTSPQTSLAFLWGSIDVGNSLLFNDAGNFIVSGTAAEAAAAGYISNLLQERSVWVVINTDTPFTTVTASSSTPSFEFGMVAASTTPFVANPEPINTALVGSGILFLAAYRLRRTKRTIRSE